MRMTQIFLFLSGRSLDYCSVKYGSGRSSDRARRSHGDRWRGRETGHSNSVKSVPICVQALYD